MSWYQEQIRQIVVKRGHIGTDPRHVEAYMRLSQGTLDSLSKGEFAALAGDCLAAVAIDPRQAEALAQSFGL